MEYSIDGVHASEMPLALALEGDLWSWNQIPSKLIRWAWRSRGYVSLEEHIQLCGLTEEEVETEVTNCRGMLSAALQLEKIPEVPPSELEWIGSPQHGEVQKMMLRFDPTTNRCEAMKHATD